MSLLKISGPPGTGKTTRLLNIMEEYLASGVDPEDIVFTTFTKAGADEARNRACARFKLSPARLPWFRTLHSICYQSAPRGGGVMNNADWCTIARLIGIPFTLKLAAGEGLAAGATKGDAMLMLMNMERVTRKPPEEIWRNRDRWASAFPSLMLNEYEHFKKVVRDYKCANGKIDYTDMLESFLAPGVNPPDVTHVIVDEAQDLSFLQWEVVAKIRQAAQQVVIAGDDDQAIHEWGGAEPSMLIHHKADIRETLGKSYRIPLNVHRIASGISRRIRNRIEKTYAPREEAGEVVWTSDLDKIPLKEPGSWLLLARNQFHLNFLEAACLRAGVPYASVNQDKKLVAAAEAVRCWQILQSGGAIGHADAVNLYNHMSQRDRVERGFKTRLAAESAQGSFNHTYLTETFGLKAAATMSWDKALDMLPGQYLSYLRAVASNSGQPKIEISTIHGAKGREADNVVLMLEMTHRTMESFRRDPDAEHRVWYVGVTRAKKRLFLVNGQGQHNYQMPSC